MPVRLYRKKSKADVRPPEDSSQKNSPRSLQTSPALSSTPPIPSEASPQSSSRSNEADQAAAASSSSSSSSSPNMARSATQVLATRVTRSSNSEDSTMEDFWREVEHIEECQSQEAIVLVRTPEDGELEAEWLHAAGLAVLVSDVSASPAPSCRSGTQPSAVIAPSKLPSATPPSAMCAGEDAEGRTLLSTLTRVQAAAVARRLDTYTQTVRRRRHRPATRDVRDVFPASAVEQESLDNGTSQPPESNQSTEQPSTNSTPRADSQSTEKRNGALSAESCTLSAQEEAEVADLQSDVPYSDQATSGCQATTITEEEGNTPSAGAPCAPHPCLGTTRLDDLSAQDMKKIRFLALIELTALLDALTIDFKRSKAIRTKVKENGLFGVPLPMVLEQDQRKFPGTRVPIFLQKLLCHLEETSLNAEGILRVPGSAARIKELRRELEEWSPEGGRLDWRSLRPHDAAALLKLYVRELPSPLLTEQHQPAFACVQSIAVLRHKLQALNLLVLLLPDANRDTLKALLEFLWRVCENERENRMSLRNVAMVMAPNLFLPRGQQRGGKPSDQRHMMQAGAGIVGITRLLIKHQELLWTVPAFLVRQLRDVCEAQKRKPVRERSMRKLLKKGSSEKERQPQDRKPRETIHSEVPEGIIRVQAPRLLKVSMAIQLTEHITAGDIVERFQSNLSHASNGAQPESDMEEHRLYEVGGNIGERCLDNQTCMLALYHVNPLAEWVIKPRGLPTPNAAC